MNNGAVDAGIKEFHEVNYPASWLMPLTKSSKAVRLRNTSRKLQNRCSNRLATISRFPHLSAAKMAPCLPALRNSKSGPALHVPSWDNEKCIGCLQCSFVCPHATVRPCLTTKEETAAAPAGYKVAVKAKSGKEYDLAIVVDQLDCLECGSCVNVCPVQALTMVPNTDEERKKMEFWYYATEKVAPKANPQNKKTVIGSQFEQPLLEFSGAAQAAVKHRMSNSLHSSSATA